MEILKLTIGLLAIMSCCSSKPAPEDLLSSAKEQFRPYRNHIKLWFNNFLLDEDIRPNAEYITCDVCKLGFPMIRNLLSEGFTPEVIAGLIIQVCIQLNIQEAEVCEGTVRSYVSPLVYIIEHKPDYEMGDFCGIINPGCAPVKEALTNWTIDINRYKPPLKNLPMLPADVKPAKILQLTDIHLDVDYIVGSNADCGKPRCCYEVGSTNPDPNMLAGEFGHYQCGLPQKALDVMLEHARDTHKPDFVFLTGDYTHYGIWQYSQEMNGKNIRAVTEAVAKAFPDTPTYPLVGNHEPDIVNMFPPENMWGQYDISWMYNNVSAPFTKWLGPEQLATFHKGGYYSVSPKSGLRLIIVNTNLCYVNNFWLAYDPIDPTGHLAWFAKELLAAENAGENVLILGHVPPGSECWPVWSNWFDRIVNRFENIIRGQFYGHKHTEMYTLSFDRGTERPTTVLYTAPSGINSGMNSGYKIFYADGTRGKDSTWEIYDHETWILNITTSNKENTPQFELLFNAREAFGIPTMRPYLLYALSKQMIYDDDMFDKFEWFHNKGLSTRGHCVKDDMNCRMNMICDTVIADSGDESHCQFLRELASKRIFHQSV